MKSLRRTMLVWVTAVMAVVGIAAATASYYFAKHEADSLLDNQLRQIALNAGEGLSADALPPARRKLEHEVAVQIWDRAGTAIIHTSPFDIPRQAQLGFTDIRFADKAWRIYTSSDGQRTVQVAQRWSVRNELAENAAFGAALPIVGAIPVTWLIVIFAINRLMHRLAGFAETLAQRSVDAKDPIPLGNVPAEIAPLNVALNALIKRHQHAVDQQRQFVSDAAHEIRTPLAALQIQVDNLKTYAKDAQKEAIDEMNGGVRRVCALIDQLLRLARVDGGASASERLDASLNDLIAAVVADYVVLAMQRNVDLGLTNNDMYDIQLSDPEIRVLLANLIDNAIRYTPSGGKIDVILKPAGKDAWIEVIDSGCGIPHAALPRIFDRFFRAAPPDIEGTGLGLAIAKAVADRNGFRLSIVNREDAAGVVARVEIPGRPDRPGYRN